MANCDKKNPSVCDEEDEIFNTAISPFITPNQSQKTNEEEEKDEDDKSVLILGTNTRTQEKFVVHSKLAKHLKSHQIDGLKFLFGCCFGEATAASRMDKSRGCILAHCMGLGKTLQVIALIHSVIQYPQLGTQRILIICPKSTILNWDAEIKKWLSPFKSGRNVDIFMFSENSTIHQKIDVLSEWFEMDSVTGNARCLLLGYETFLKTVTKPKRRNRTTEEAKLIEEAVTKYLLKPGADLVVLDEGHRVKNRKTAINEAVNRISTKKRIILTGTPMQNNLNEYYSMVSFVKPDFLGSIAQFEKEYVNPIRAGQHKDSAPEFVQGMVEKSFILNKRLTSFVHRRDVTVLQEFLPEKFEYDIFVTMTDIQYKLYEHYLEKNPMTDGNHLLPDYHAFRRIWSHPKVLQYAQEAVFDVDNCTPDGYESSSSDYWNDAESNNFGYRLDRDGELHGNEVNGENRMFSPKHNWWKSIVTQKQLNSLSSSHKMKLLFGILRLCDNESEKCLIFSEYTKVLDVVEMMMDQITEKIEWNTPHDGLDDFGPNDNVWKRALDYHRIDGSTMQSDRFGIIKQFNDPNEKRLRVLLISTRAVGQGVNLIGASRVVLLDTSWNPSNDQHSIFRVFRMGQTRNCYIYRLLAMGTMEEKIYSRSVTKQATSRRVVDKQQIERLYNMAELVEFYKLTRPNVDTRPVKPNDEPKDKLLAILLDEHKDRIFKYQKHESLFVESPETVLTQDREELLWSAYRLQEIMNSRAKLARRRHVDYSDDSHTTRHASSSSSNVNPLPKTFFGEKSSNRRPAPYLSPSNNKKKNSKSGLVANKPEQL